MRPQDQDLYEDFIDVLEFKTDELGKQKTLFHIYAEEKTWNSDMNVLITNFNKSILCPIISEELIKRRMNCKQICAEGKCHFCYSSMDFSINASNAAIDEFIQSF